MWMKENYRKRYLWPETVGFHTWQPQIWNNLSKVAQKSPCWKEKRDVKLLDFFVINLFMKIKIWTFKEQNFKNKCYNEIWKKKSRNSLVQ